MKKFFNTMYSIICESLLASQLTRCGRWRSAYKLMKGEKHAI